MQPGFTSAGADGVSDPTQATSPPVRDISRIFRAVEAGRTVKVGGDNRRCGSPKEDKNMAFATDHSVAAPR